MVDGMQSWVEPHCWLIVMVSTGLVGLLAMWVTFKPPSPRTHWIWMSVFAALTVCGIGAAVVDHNAGEREKREAAGDRKTSLAAMGRLQRSSDEIARTGRAAQLQYVAEMGYMRGKLDAIELVLSSSGRRTAAVAALSAVSAAAPSVNQMDERDNSELRVQALGVAAKIRDLVKAYDDASQSLSQEHVQALERVWQSQNPRKDDDEAMWAAIDKDIERLGNPDSFRDYSKYFLWHEGNQAKSKDRSVKDTWQTFVRSVKKPPSKAERDATLKALAARVAGLDVSPPPRSTDINDEYIERAFQNLQGLISSFQARHQMDARLYKQELLSRLPAGVANAQISYDAVPLAPSQITALADDLERLAKLLPPK